MGVGTCQKMPLSVLARNPHKRFVREISYETGRGRGKEGPIEKRSQSAEETRAENKAVSRRSLSKEVDRIDQSREQGSRQESGEADGRKKWLQEPVVSDAGLANVRR